MDLIESSPHRRYNPLTDQWILVSPQRTKRPWQGKIETLPSTQRPEYDPNCYLCPGNLRANGETNPPYKGTYVFDNDFTALLPKSEHKSETKHLLLQQESVEGICRVVCFSPRHDLTLPMMSCEEIRGVIDALANETAELGKRYQWVQFFENKGDIMGCSNPHPHGQIWAETALPTEAFKENESQYNYFRKENKNLLLDYIELEKKEKVRIVLDNEYWMVVVPFWAIWPFETLLVPKQHVLRLPDLSDKQRNGLSEILKRLAVRYDNLFQISFPYTMGWHGAPFGASDFTHWQLHAHFYPPLLRSATVRKFMVGYEMLAEPQRDITAEQAAERLKSISDVHYLLNQ